MFNFGAYEEQRKPFTAKLVGGMEISGEYRVNFLTSNTISAMAARTRYRKIQVEQADGSFVEELLNTTPLVQVVMESGQSMTVPDTSTSDMFENKVDDLALHVLTLDIEEKGKPFSWPKKDEERIEKLKEVFRRFDFEDLNRISKAINEDMTAPLGETGTSSSTG